MENFVIYKLIFTCEAITDISLPSYSGSSLRGAFFEALRHDFCLNKNMATCLHCPTSEVCPICRLVATVEHSSERGAEIPRPFSLQPIIKDNANFKPGQPFSFGITIFGKTLALFPYAILAIQRMGQTGIGQRAVSPGLFELREVKATNPLLNNEQPIYSINTRIVNVPDLSITHDNVMSFAAKLVSDELCLNLLTPLRLVLEGRLVQQLTFRIFMQRLLRRLTDLNRYYCNRDLGLDFREILKHAEKVQTLHDDTNWFDLSSYSNRRHSRTPVGGLTGCITFKGDVANLLPLIIWGSFTHIGKDTTRGNGWYQIAGSLS